MPCVPDVSDAGLLIERKLVLDGRNVQDHTTLALDHSHEKIHRSALFVQILTFLSHILTASHGKPR